VAEVVVEVELLIGKVAAVEEVVSDISLLLAVLVDQDLMVTMELRVIRVLVVLEELAELVVSILGMVLLLELVELVADGEKLDK